ncbi:MAG: penicillin-binding protein activator, partial [Lysobacter sp.]
TLGIAITLLGGCAAVATRPDAAVVETPASRDARIQQAAELVQTGASLSGAARTANDAQIDRLMSQLDDATLTREAAGLAVGDPLYDYIGRALLRRGLPLPRPFDRGAWQFASNRPAADRDGYRPPMKLAVLLPLSGSLATAASPVRDGLLAAYYGESRRRPDIQFYDTVGGAVAAYDRAVAEGNDFVVGPLGRDEVSALFARGSLPVPVLALNRGTARPPAGTASFSLSPEDEGIAAAEYLLDHGARRVLVIGGSDETQRRAVASLRERLGERGASVTDVAPEGTTDFAPFAQKEGGVDAVFLAVKGSSARTLMPKLALAGLADRPRTATSQLLTGTGKAEQDRVLDGIAFPSETWTTHGVRGLPAAASVGATLPTARGPAARLFAFGHDAWLLTAYLEHLALSANGEIAGATGTLRIDGFGNIQRTPSWSTFSGGVAVPLADAGRR